MKQNLSICCLHSIRSRCKWLKFISMHIFKSNCTENNTNPIKWNKCASSISDLVETISFKIQQFRLNHHSCDACVIFDGKLVHYLMEYLTKMMSHISWCHYFSWKHSPSLRIFRHSFWLNWWLQLIPWLLRHFSSSGISITRHISGFEKITFNVSHLQFQWDSVGKI